MARVLIIWANASERHVLEAMLGKRYKVIGVASLADASPHVAQERCDAIIARQGKSDSTGFAALERLKSDGLDIPTIILSGHSDEGTESRAEEMGAVALLRPPIHATLLFQTLNRAIREKNERKAEREKALKQSRERELMVKDLKGRLVQPRGLLAAPETTERHILETMLKGKYNITAVESGREAIVELKKGMFDVIIAKLQRDGKCGMAVLRYLSAKGRDMPVLLISSPGASALAEQATRLGARHVFHPPVNAAKMNEALKEAVMERRQSSLEHAQTGRGAGYRPV